MGGPKITLESMIAASDAIKSAPPAPKGMRMNLTTLAFCQAELPPPEGARVFPIFEGIAVYRDNELATGIVEVDWTDGRIETIDLMVREV